MKQLKELIACVQTSPISCVADLYCLLFIVLFAKNCTNQIKSKYLNSHGEEARFNEEKCEAMRITHSRDKSTTNYKLGTALKDVKSFKDLGIIISKDLTWSEHISTMVNKANQVLGLIRRSVGTANTTTFSLLYKTLVRPLLEYAAPVWNPYLVKDIHAIESVQRRASRLALRQKRGDMSYEERCDTLHWLSLSSRRTYSSLEGPNGVVAFTVIG